MDALKPYLRVCFCFVVFFAWLHASCVCISSEYHVSTAHWCVGGKRKSEVVHMGVGQSCSL